MSIQYFIVTLGILLAKIVGFLRDIIFAGKFGATAASDIYFGVFGVVTLLFTGIGMALSTLAIKNLGRLELGTENERRAYVSSFITRTFLFTAAGAVLMAVFARALVAVLLPDLREDMIPTAVTVTRIMTPSLCFVCVAYVISGVLQNSRRFFIPSIVSLPYNVILIAQLLFTDPDVIAVSVVTTIGWGLHIVFQLPQFYRLGYRMFSRGGKGSFGVGEAAAIFASNMGFQLCFIIDRRFVSGSEGAITSVNYASNLFVTVSSVFVVAMSSVIFPAISKNHAEGKLDYVRGLVGAMITLMFVIFVPYLLVAATFGHNIVSLLWERGEFTAEAASTTSASFLIYSLGVFGYIAQELFSKVLYLSSRYIDTVCSAAAVIIIKLLTGGIVYEHLGVYGVAAETSLLLTIYAVYISLRMKTAVGKYITRSTIRDAGRVLLSGLAALAVYVIFRAAAPGICADRVMFLLPLSVCGAAYIAVIFATGLHKSLFADIKKRRED